MKLSERLLEKAQRLKGNNQWFKLADEVRTIGNPPCGARRKGLTGCSRSNPATSFNVAAVREAVSTLPQCLLTRGKFYS